MQDCRVRQCFHHGHADEGRDVQIGNTDLVAMGLEIAT